MGHKAVPVTHLRKLMLEELQRRHYSEATTHYYIRAVEAFARDFQCPPDRLGPRHIREYQAQLFAKRKLSPGAVTNHLCALIGPSVWLNANRLICQRRLSKES